MGRIWEEGRRDEYDHNDNVQNYQRENKKVRGKNETNISKKLCWENYQKRKVMGDRRHQGWWDLFRTFIVKATVVTGVYVVCTKSI